MTVSQRSKDRGQVTTKQTTKNAKKAYTIKFGCILNGLHWRRFVSTSSLAEQNHISNGQKLYITAAGLGSGLGSEFNTTHTAQIWNFSVYSSS